MTALLEVESLDAGYGGSPIVRDLDITVRAGEVHLLLGPNGAGKTTTLLTIAGELAPLAGSITVDGDERILPMHRRTRQGLSLITEERSVFMGQSVADNLRIGGGTVDDALELFPELSDHLKRSAGLLSGGQQQMLTLARALARKPRILLADELSLGLAPLIVERLLSAVRSAADGGLAVLLVEQHVAKALTIADTTSVLVRGRIAMMSPAEDLRKNPESLTELYLASGVTARAATHP